MSVRAIDENRDWVFGQGQQSYKINEAELGQQINTRVLSFLGDCFFAINEGIDWWNLLDYRYQDRLENAVTEVVKNTEGVTGLNNVDVLVNAERNIRIYYDVQTIYSQSYTGEITPIQAR